MKSPITGINKQKLVKFISIFIIAVALIAIATVQVGGFYMNMKAAWPAIVFAYNNPDIVEPVKQQYEIEFSELKDSIIQRQSMIDVQGIESPKE